jgi:dihydropteroate synthase
MNSASAPFRIMGVVNVTPDSFSDGGRYLDAAAAIAHGLELEAEGAAILDVGGESTRPGAAPVAQAEELRRVLPVIEGVIAAGCRAQISIDTSKSGVAARALAAGATLINDVTAFRADPEIAAVVAEANAGCCLMHMLGTPRTMQLDPRYDDVVGEIKAFLEERMAFAVAHGIAEDRILLDPGIGFGKTVEHNLELLRRLEELVELGRPVVIGTSRKSFLGKITGREVDGRVAATVATNVLAYERGARVFRVHDVAPVHDALTVTAATVSAPWTTPTNTTT